MPMKEELISVIVPVYNIEKYLPKCLECIESQTYRNLEIILVDDGSTDRSGVLCDEFVAKDSRARVIHQPNTGLWAARNIGQDNARGDYLWFPDGDDYFHKDILSILYGAINSGKGYDLAICHKKKTMEQNEDTCFPVPVRLVEVTQKDLFLCLFNKNLFGNFYSHNMWNKLFRRSLIEGHRNNPFPVAQDRDFLMRLYLYVKDAILVDNFLYYWVRRPDSIMQSDSYPALRSMCHIKMDYCTYLSLPKEGAKYKYLILEDLYNHLLLWRDMTLNTSAGEEVSSVCKTVINHTWNPFLCCRDIPFRKRTACLFLVQFPRLTHYIINYLKKKSSK